MEGIFLFLQNNFPVLFEHKHVFLFLGAMVEGLNTMILGGFLISAGALPFFSTALVFIIGYTVNGYLWYGVGYFAGAKPLDRWVRKGEKGRVVLNRVQYYFEQHSGKAIVITKFTFSMTIVALIMAGSLRYNFRKFSFYNLIGSIGWVGLTMSIGYFFGQSYKFFFDYLWNFTYLILFFIGAVASVYILKALSRSAFIKAVMEHDRMRHFKERLGSRIINVEFWKKWPK